MTLPDLDMFGRRYRPRSGNSAVEFRLQCAIADVLARFKKPGWIYSHLPFGEFRNPATAGRLKRMGTRAGFPDLILVGPWPDLFLELKRRGAKPSEAQAEVAIALMQAGAAWAVADNFDDAVGILKDFGVIPMTIHPG